MSKYDINLDTKDKNLILTPFQFLYPLNNHLAHEIETHKFQKAKITAKCENEDTIFTFYNTLRHIAGSFNILLLPLSKITKETGTCLLTPTNCIGYEHAREAMSSALHIKLTTGEYFKGFPQAQSYVNAAANNSDGFRLIYRIIEIIHPKLRAAKGGIHKSIDPPQYSNVEDDSIYTFINSYKNYLLYKLLSPEKRQYNKAEQTAFITTSLSNDDHFQPGVEYVKSNLLTYQQERSYSINTTFPIDLEIDKIGVTIDERSPEYEVGASPTANPYATQGSIRAMTGSRRNYNKQRDHKQKQSTTGKPCLACGAVGYCISDTEKICYQMAKHHLCAQFLGNERNADKVKSNTYRFKTAMRDKIKTSKMSDKMESFIKKLAPDLQDTARITPLINVAKELWIQSDNDSDSEENSTATDNSISE